MKSFFKKQRSLNASLALALMTMYLLAACSGLTPPKQTDPQVKIESVTANNITLSGVINLQGDTTITADNLYVKSDAVISSLRYNLTINATEIIADGGLIQNYPLGTVDCIGSANHASSFPGGDIEIKAKKASGRLHFQLVGSNGCPTGIYPGTSGGSLKIQIEDGKGLIPTVQLNQSIGASYEGWNGANGALGTSCVSLSKDDGHACL